MKASEKGLPNKKEIGNHIYLLAKQHQLSVDDLCYYCGVSETTVYNWFSGKLPGRDHLVVLSMLFKTTINEILMLPDFNCQEKVSFQFSF